MLEDYLWPELDELDINDMWFQQDGAISHTACVTIDLLKGKFGERVISRNSPFEWPPRSCDLTPLDFFLWSHIKSLVYANKPATLDHLKDNIQRKIANVPVKMCARVVEYHNKVILKSQLFYLSKLELLFSLQTIKLNLKN